MGRRLNQDREQKLQPIRVGKVVASLTALDLEIIGANETTVKFLYKGNTITVFPYSGWFSGKGIKDGRGFENLLKQLTQ